jgi:hypothetical protein
MVWMAAASAGLSCLPLYRVETRAARFNAICVSTGKSARATLIHWALHPVAINEMVNTTASTILLIEFEFMSAFSLSGFL